MPSSATFLCPKGCPRISILLAMCMCVVQVPRADSLKELHTILAASAAAGGVLAVFFFVEWCGPCRRFAPAFAALRTEFPTVGFIRVDADRVPEAAELYQVFYPYHSESRPTSHSLPFSTRTHTRDDRFPRAAFHSHPSPRPTQIFLLTAWIF